jgi:hypothetical protein
MTRAIGGHDDDRRVGLVIAAVPATTVVAHADADAGRHTAAAATFPIVVACAGGEGGRRDDQDNAD